MKYDLIVIGSGPGGYVAAIRAAQLEMKVAVIEKAEPGGICLNWGCIPTKSLLKSAKVYDYIKHAADYGIGVDGEVSADLGQMVERSRSVADGMSKGVQYLFKKNKIEVIKGLGRLKGDVEAPRYAVLSKEPCDECKRHMQMGIMIIEVKDGCTNPDESRTGKMTVLKESTLLMIAEDLGWDVAQIKKHRVLFIEKTSLKKLLGPMYEETFQKN